MERDPAAALRVDFRSKINAVKLVLILSVFILLIKFAAWYTSGSEAILSDALESFINIAASSFTLYSLYYGSRLRDQDHPYGHGKIEYFAVGFEGALILATGIYIFYNSTLTILNPHPIQNVDLGLILTVFGGLAMYLIGRFLQQRGEQLGSPALVADGKHFHTDALTSAALVIGLVVYKFSGWYWVDPLLATLLALHIIFSGYKLVREAGDRLMDKVDLKLIERLSQVLHTVRTDRWIDIHNMRLQQFGHYLHLDCHITLPFYLSLEEVHDEIKQLESVLNSEFKNQIEIFVHTDPCQAIPCSLCAVADCKYRKHTFVRKIRWTPDLLMTNRKHSLTEKSISP